MQIYSLSGVQLYYELLVGASLTTCDHQTTCVNISWGSDLLAPARIRMLVVSSVDVLLQKAITRVIFVIDPCAFTKSSIFIL